MEADEGSTVRALTALREEVTRLAREHGGRVVDSPGDNLLAEFPSAVEAARCAIEVQRSMATRNSDVSPDRRMELRIGVHLGDVMVEGERIYGDGINVASRLEGLATAGGVCISGTAYDVVRNRLDVPCEDLGLKSIKNVRDPVRVYRIRPTAEATIPPSKSDWSRRAALWALVLAVVVGGAAAIRWAATTGGERFGDEGRIESLAVLPLDNLSEDSGDEYFSDGMTEALIGELAQIGALRVISRTSVMQYKDARKPLPEIARELDVDAIVEGSVLRAGDRVRITAQLIHAPTDRHLWAKSYERDLSDVLTLQREVAESIARQVHAELRPTGAPPTQVRPDVHEAYLKGRYYLGNLDFETGIGYVERAIDLQSDYAPAHAALAEAYVWMAMYLGLRPEENLARAEAAAMRALELDESLSEAHVSLGMVWMLKNWDWPAVEREFQRALELNPSNARAHQLHAFYLAAMGRGGESLAEARRARELDPLSASTQTFYAGLYASFTRDYDRAIELLEEGLERTPNYLAGVSYLGWMYSMSGREEEALETTQRAVEMSDRNVDTLATLAYVYASFGRRDEALQIVGELEEKAREGYASAFPIGMAYAGLGDRDRAIEWLQRAVDRHDPQIFYIKWDSVFDPLHADPRFQVLLEEIGLPIEPPSRGPLT
jgi:TolB-like protein/Flp pilus assembly protein TadD